MTEKAGTGTARVSTTAMLLLAFARVGVTAEETEEIAKTKAIVDWKSMTKDCSERGFRIGKDEASFDYSQRS